MIVDLTARLGLMPLLIAQAIYARARAIELPEPAGDRRGVIGSGPSLRILIIGDSSALGVGVERQDEALLGQVTQRLSRYATIEFELIARIGAKTSEVLTWLDTLPRHKYDVVITALGVNDVTKGVSLRRWLHQQNTLMDRLIADFGARRVIVSGLPPVSQFPLLPQPLRWVLGRQAARFDRSLGVLVGRRVNCVHVRADMTLDRDNMSADGYHPGPVVYARWGEKVVNAILRAPGLLDAQRDSA